MTLGEVMREREQLLERCDTQRQYVGALAGQFAGTLKIADGAVAGIKYLRSHPVLLGIAAAALAAARGRGILKWARRGFLAWRAYRTLRN
jgi:hypothetical protein